MPARHYYTAADLMALPDDGTKCEVVHGELLVSPAPRMQHQRIVGRLFHLLFEYVARHPIGEVHPGGNLHVGVDSLVIPDLLVIDLESARSGDWTRVTKPLLVVEVLSTSTARQDRFTKRRLYQEVGVPLYWLVDTEARTVEVWTPESLFPTTENGEIRWHPAGAAVPLVISLAELFRAP